MCQSEVEVTALLGDSVCVVCVSCVCVCTGGGERLVTPSVRAWELYISKPSRGQPEKLQWDRSFVHTGQRGGDGGVDKKKREMSERG